MQLVLQLQQLGASRDSSKSAAWLSLYLLISSVPDSCSPCRYAATEDEKSFQLWGRCAFRLHRQRLTRGTGKIVVDLAFAPPGSGPECRSPTTPPTITRGCVGVLILQTFTWCLPLSCTLAIQYQASWTVT
ncbi:hypothetical protein HD806DRAFT_507672 [Xylariaceae sp. AK1471]|nr:hypothetical protein HD806DRAFT_507672 [Xylariaceae sp. AK1471]